MTGDKLSLKQFASLVQVASRRHRKQIAGLVSLTAHISKGGAYFKNRMGRTVPLEEVHQTCEGDADIRRRVYNLYIHYAHFG